MKLGPYALELETLPSVMRNFVDSVRVRTRGIPPRAGDTPAEIARQTLKDNAREVLYAGTGHFRYLWVSDFGKALRGAEKVLSPKYLRGLIEWMIRESFRQGRVTSCFTARHGFDMPYDRGDNLPWLVYSVAEYQRWTGDASLVEETRPALQRLLEAYERSHFKDGLIDTAVTGDWVDTILRPSSTYNNLCALKMLLLAPGLGLRAATDPAEFGRRILEDRWRGDHFIDYAGASTLGVDAAVYTLYFELFDAALREKAIARIEASGLTKPYPIKCAPQDYDTALMPLFTRLTARYHSSIWLHLGLVYLNGLRKNGRDVSLYKAELDGLFMKYRNMVEAVDDRGEPYRTFFHSSEYGLTMCAGQYLELALD